MKNLKILFVYLFFISIFLELCHSIIPQRSFEYMDLFGNVLGMVPYNFTYTSHIIVTFGLAGVIFLGVTIILVIYDPIVTSVIIIFLSLFYFCVLIITKKRGLNFF